VTKYYTSDGVEVELGLVVWTNEMLQGEITKVALFPGDHPNEWDVWHEVTYPTGRVVSMNRSRITTRKPF
jgi:hypothetical protein